MCGGGGGGGGADPWGPGGVYYEQNRQTAEDNRKKWQADFDQGERDKASAADAATKAQALQTATDAAPDLVKKYFSDRGITPDQGTVDRITTAIKNTIPAGDANPAQYFNNDAIAGQVSGIETSNRQGYNAQVDKYFTPGFEKAWLPSSLADPIVNSILGEQRKQANTALDYNKARGVLNDTGFGAATSALGSQESAGRGTIQSLAESVLGKDRQKLTDIRGEAGTAASNYSFGQAAPDFAGFRTRADQQYASDLSGIEGSVRSAVGGTNYFDVPTALQKGGTLQGPINLTTAGAGGTAPPVDPTKRTQTGRGVGSSGIF